MRAHFEVGAREGGAEVEERGAAAPAAPRGAVHRREAFLPVAVQVVGALEAGRDAGLDERLEQRIGGLRLGDGERAVASVVGVRSGVAGLRLPEIRQTVPVRPVREARDPGPLVVVEGVSADVDHAVDGRRAAEGLAARAVHPSPVHPRLRIGDVGPVVRGAVLGIRERGRHPDPPLPPRHRPPRLDDEHPHVRVLGEPAREHAPGGAGPDDDVVVAALGHGDVPLDPASGLWWRAYGKYSDATQQQNFTRATTSGKTRPLSSRSEAGRSATGTDDRR